MNSLPVGTQVRLKIACLKNSPSTMGYVFNDYGQGCQVIFENGAYDGFSYEEIPQFLEVVGLSDFTYNFRNVIKLAQDFDDGLFTKNNCFRLSGDGDNGGGSQPSPKVLAPISDDEVRAVFIDIANGVGNHGSFLVAFADALLRADAENFQLLKPIGETLIRKYGL